VQAARVSRYHHSPKGGGRGIRTLLTAWLMRPAGTPVLPDVVPVGIEPTCVAFQTTANPSQLRNHAYGAHLALSLQETPLSEKMGSNHQPSPYQGDALTTEPLSVVTRWGDVRESDPLASKFTACPPQRLDYVSVDPQGVAP
jgi:hypothetical protein